MSDLVPPAHPEAGGHWRQSWERLRRDRLGVGAGLIIVLLVALAMGAPLLTALVTHHAPADQDVFHPYAAPGPNHWLGSDHLGRDLLTRLIYGSQVSLGVGFLAVAVTLALGTTVGMAAGYYGGWIDEILMRLVDILLSIPAIFLFIMMAILFRPGVVTLALIIASVGWGVAARLVRAETLSLRARDFILAARSIGATDLRLMGRHLLPNLLPTIIVYASFNLGQVMLAEAALDYLGLGVRDPTPSWGNLLSYAPADIYHSTPLVLFPGLAIFVAVLGATLFGNALRDAFDPRLKGV